MRALMKVFDGLAVRDTGAWLFFCLQCWVWWRPGAELCPSCGELLWGAELREERSSRQTECRHLGQQEPRLAQQ